MASDRTRVERAAAKYGRSVDHIAARYTNPVTGKRLTGAALLMKTAMGESGFNRNSVSPVGAKGIAQFMPSSRSVVLSRFGVDPWKSPEEAIHAMALHLRGKVNGKAGLEGYNPGGGQGYVDYILRQKVGAVSPRAGAPAPPTSSNGGTAAPAPDKVSVSGTGFNPGVATPQQSVPQTSIPASIQSAPLTPPPNTPGPTLPKAYRALVTGGVTPPQEEPQQAPVLGGGGEFALPDVSVTVKPGEPAASSSSRTSTGGGGGGTRVRGAYRGSPVPGQKPQRATHDTDGLPGYPAFDYMAPPGKSVVAPVSGKVIKISGKDPKLGGAPGGPLGYSVYIEGTDGKTYFLTHIDRVRPKVGARVRQGQKIAVVANGPSSWSSPHVHMGVKG